MSRDTPNGGLPPTNPNRIPPFWIRPTDDHDGPLDQRVLELAERLWPWAFRHVERELKDGPSAAETLEAVAIEVSARLRVAPDVERNLAGYLTASFRNSVRSRRLRDSRLGLEGLVREVEKNHNLKAPDLNVELERRLMLDLLLSFLPPEIQHTLHLRMLGFSWKEISQYLHLSVKQAKSRYYYGIQNAYTELTKSRPPSKKKKE